MSRWARWLIVTQNASLWGILFRISEEVIDGMAGRKPFRTNRIGLCKTVAAVAKSLAQWGCENRDTQHGVRRSVDADQCFWRKWIGSNRGPRVGFMLRAIRDQLLHPVSPGIDPRATPKHRDTTMGVSVDDRHRTDRDGVCDWIFTLYGHAVEGT